MINLLESLDVDGQELKIIKNLYWEQEAAVRVDNMLSEFIPIKRGVRQGCFCRLHCLPYTLRR